MVSPAVQGQVRHPSIVPEFLRSARSGMTSALGNGAIVYCLNSGNEARQTGRHNMLSDGDTRNRWRDGQVCPDVDKELWHLGSDGSGEKEGREEGKTGENGRKESGIGVKKTMNAGGVENGI
ncbi:hypothetical protein TNCV_3217461 [Trichonephila clavipes]|nr:hypothetical protein TNCV_3217461 [Trichonephila clavipes]